MSRKVRHICLIAIACASALVGCGETTDYAAEQREKFASYLSAYQYTVQDEVYRYVAGTSAADDAPVAERGDSVAFYFAGYVFTTAPQTMFYTNKSYLIEEQSSLNPQYWSTDPVRVKIGDGSIIKGMENALPNCRQGDSLVVLIPSKLGYGGEAMGIVPENTALMYVLNIVSVNK